MLFEILSLIEGNLLALNTSKYFAGIMMLLMNLGSKYVSEELSEIQSTFISHRIMRRILVFVLVFYATRDIKVALILTAVFVVLVSGILHEDSKYCVLPNKIIEKKEVTRDEYLTAKKIVDRYEKINGLI
jgi:cobalamin synthase